MQIDPVATETVLTIIRLTLYRNEELVFCNITILFS